ncbi:MAG: diguanylate cyclase [Candidatus Saccharicenans sp.]|uniref:diguanylate cyclase n=1 Tax=Candidatus Saccharicenans sp. TaxID=2819258 RepID=UPI0040494606
MTETDGRTSHLKLFNFKPKIVLKFMLISIPFLTLISLALFLIAPQWYKHNSIKNLIDKSHSLNLIASHSLSAAVVFEDTQEIKKVLLHISQSPEIRYIVVFDNQGRELSRFLRDETITIDLEKIKRTGYLDDRRTWNTYYPIKYEDRTVGYLAMAFSLDTAYAQTHRIRKIIGLASLLIFGLGLLIIYYLSLLTTRPIRRMTRIAREIAAGNLSLRAEVHSKDEVGVLASSFNTMVDQLQQSLSSLQEIRNNLEKIVNDRTIELKRQIQEKEEIARRLEENEALFRNMVENLGEGVVIADSEENFIFANEAAIRIFEQFEEGLVGHNLNEFLSPDQFELVQSHTRRRRRNIKDKYELQITLKNGKKKNLMVSAVPQLDNRGNYMSTLAVITDITRQKEEEQASATAKQELEKAIAELQRSNQEAALQSEMGDALQLANSEKEFTEIIVNYAQKFFPEYTGLLYLRPDRENFLQLSRSWNLNHPVEELINLEDCWAIRKASIYLVTDPESQPVCPHLRMSKTPGMASSCLPINSFGATLGLLVIVSGQAASTNGANSIYRQGLDSKKQLMITFAQRASMALANIRLRESLKEQSIRDPLTGLYNRRYLEETVQREFIRAKRAGQTVSVIMLDIDHFKKFNDTYSHEAGDLVLQKVAQVIQKAVRAEDCVCRYGGEEFTIIMPGLELAKASSRAGLILNLVRHLEINYNGAVLKNLTVSAGVASYPEHGQNWSEVIQAADEALLQAKKNGRNRIEVAKKLTEELR